MMGVRYRRVDAAAWHPEVQAYVVSDAASGRRLGTLWVDLYPRAGKYNSAAVWPLRSSSTLLGRDSQAALVVNFDRTGLTLDELETLLHELGHAVHDNLSATRYVLQAGTTVERDFVETPSQMLEDWVYDKRVLALFAEVCPRCEPVPDALVEKADAARHFAKGIAQSRQHLYASYDLALYGPQPPDPLELWERMEGATPLGHVRETMFPAGFSHIAGGYSAGYYGYLWSLVVAMDLRTAFAADKLSPEVGLRYRNTVLGQGGQKPAQELVHDFLGRDSNSKAFFDYLRK
jgi:thimet oligopeptidase